MYPGQFYTREFLGLTKSKSKTRVYQGKVSINDLSSDRWVFFNGKLRMAFMNNMNEDLSRGAIIQKQLSQIKHDFPVDKELTEQIRLIGKEFRNIRGLSNKAELTEEEAIDIIESVFSATIGEGRFDNKIMLEVLTTPIKDSPYGIEVYQQALDTLIDLRDLLFKESGFMPGQRFRDYYKKILRAINVLQRDIATSGGYSSPYLDFTTEKSTSPISAIISAGKRIKGRFFENGTKKFVQKKIVTPIYGKNAVVVDTSVLQVPHISVWGTASSKETDAWFDQLILGTDSPIKIEYICNGKLKNASISTFISDLEKNNGNSASLSISNDELNKLFNSDAFIGGIQAKSGWGQKVTNAFNNKNFAFTGLEAYMMISSRHALMWNNMVEWYQYKHIVANHSILDAYFALGIAKKILYLIGQGNNILSIRGEIITTYDYFEEQFLTRNAYIRGIEKLSLANPDKRIKINISGRNDSYSR